MELHDALTDLAGTVTDDPHRLANVHARHRRRRRTRVAVTAASTAGVVGAAVVVGALAFSPSSSGGLQANLAAGAVWVDVATSGRAPSAVTSTTLGGGQSALGPKVAKQTCGVLVPADGPPKAMVPADGRPEPPPRPEPLSTPVWTRTPPPAGVPFSLNGTVTGTTSDSVTITVSDGPSEGTFVFPSVCDPPLAVVGAEAHIAGTRTGLDTYELRAFAVRVQPSPS